MSHTNTPTYEGRLIEDILDGYFPLGESLHQCMTRQAASTALFVLTHAPILHLPDRADTDPVPLRMAQETSGLIRRLMVIARRDETDRISLRGGGHWRWHHSDTDVPLSAQTRLAEPAFIRAIALDARVEETLWSLQIPDSAAAQWGMRSVPCGTVQRDDQTVVRAGDRDDPASAAGALIIRSTQPHAERLARSMALDWHG